MAPSIMARWRPPISGSAASTYSGSHAQSFAYSPSASGGHRPRDVLTPRERFLKIGHEADGDRHDRDPLRPVEVAHDRHHRAVVERIVDVVREDALEPRRRTAIDHRRRQIVVARKVVLDAVVFFNDPVPGELYTLSLRVVPL